MPTQSWRSKVVRAVCMATNSALMMVRVSSVPAASTYIVVLVGMCTTAAPRRGWPVMFEPSVYTHCSGRNFGAHVKAGYRLSIISVSVSVSVLSVISV